MNAYDLSIADEPENNDSDDGDRESETRLIMRRVPSAPWVRQHLTLLERALSESVLLDGAACVIQEIDPDDGNAPDGAFDVIEILMGPQGNTIGAKQAKCIAMLSNVPLHRRRRTVANDGGA